MNQPHDPVRHISLLRQALESPKRPLAIFLGAGCPCSIKINGNNPLIPDISGMTERLVSMLDQSELKDSFAELRKCLRVDIQREPNLEEYLSYIRTLLEVPSVLKSMNLPVLKIFEEKICKFIVELTDVKFPGQETPYHHLAAWVRGTPRTIPVELFTSNYDLLLEQSLEYLRVPYFDGFIGAYEAFFDSYSIESEEERISPRWARVWKLHGSINWWSRSVGNVINIIRSNQKEAGERRLIHPSHLKYDESRQMPYLAMMDRLKAFLKKPEAVLVICGYSFRDRHINALLCQALSGNQQAVAFGLLHSSLTKHAEAVKLAQTTPNLNLMATDRAVIGTRIAGWGRKAIPDDLPLGVVIRPHGGDAQEVEKCLEVTLGDFVQFGSLLQQLIGNTPASSTSPPLESGAVNGT